MAVESRCQLHKLNINHHAESPCQHHSVSCLSAVERGRAPGREGIQDGRPGRLPARGVRPDEAVLDPGLCCAALLPHAEGEAAAYQSQGALPVKRRPRGG